MRRMDRRALSACIPLRQKNLKRFGDHYIVQRDTTYSYEDNNCNWDVQKGKGILSSLPLNI